MTAFRHTTTERRPPAASQPTTTTLSFHPSATAGIFDAGASRHVIHAHTSGGRPRTHWIGSGPYACWGSVQGAICAAACIMRWSLRASYVDSYRRFFVTSGGVPSSGREDARLRRHRRHRRADASSGRAPRLDVVHVYLDDSGDGGFKFGSGSSSHLVMAACVFHSPEDLSAAVQMIEDCASRNRLSREFKYSRTADRFKDCFFSCVAPATFSVRAIIIDKSIIYSEKLRSSPSALKSYAIRQLLTRNYGQLRDAKIFIDGQDTKAFGMEDSAYLMRMVNREQPGTISQVRHVDSNASRPIQLADMIAGAINCSVRTHRPSSDRHVQTFRPRTFQPRGTYWFYK